MNLKHKNVPPGMDLLFHRNGRKSFTWYKASVGGEVLRICSLTNNFVDNDTTVNGSHTHV